MSKLKNKDDGVDATLFSNDRIIEGGGKRIIVYSILGALFLLLLLFIAYHYLVGSSFRLQVPRSSIVVSEVKETLFSETIPFSGTIKPLESVRLDVVDSGRVEEIYQEAGTQVVRGSPLFKISNEELELSIASRATAAIDQLNNQLSMQLNVAQLVTSDRIALAEETYRYARVLREIENLKILVKRGASKQNDLDRMSEDLTHCKQALDIRRTSLLESQRLSKTIEASTTTTATQLHEIIANTNRQKDALTVRAPISGLLTNLDLNIGQQLTTGFTVGHIEKNIGYKVEASLDEYYLSKVAVGQTIAFKFGDKGYFLKISNISSQIINKTFKVDGIFIGEQPKNLRSGQTILGRLEFSDTSDYVLTIATGSFWETTGGAWIYKIDADHIAQRTNIVVGRRSDNYIEIMSGLSLGDKVITSGYSGFNNQQQLKITGEEL